MTTETSLESLAARGMRVLTKAGGVLACASVALMLQSVLMVPVAYADESPEPVNPVPAATSVVAALDNPDSGVKPDGDAPEPDPFASYTFTTVEDGTYVIESEVGKVLDVAGNGTENGTNVAVWEDNGTGAQRFEVANIGADENGNALYAITGVESGKVLDVDGNLSADDSNVAIWESNGTSAQKWYLAASTIADGSPCLLIVSASSGKVLDVVDATDGANVRIYTQNGGPFQNWIFRPVPKLEYTTIEEGVYIIENEDGLVVDVNGGFSADGTNVQGWEDNGSAAQRFNVVAAGADEAGNIMYTIANYESGKALDVDSNFTADDTNIAIYESNGTAAQLWYVAASTPADDKKCYILVGAGSGKALDVAGTANGANIRLMTQNNRAAQNWIFRAIPKPVYTTIEEGVYVIQNEGGSVLDVAGNGSADGTNVGVYADNGSGAQRFKVVSAGTDAAGNILYTIIGVESGKALDVAGNGTAERTNVAIWESNSTTAQQWYLAASATATGDPCYILVGAGSGKALATASSAADANVYLYTQNLSASQNWIFRAVPKLVYTTVDEGAYIIQNEGGLVLDVAGGSINDGANIQGWDDNGSGAQRFHISAAGRDDNGNTYYNIVSIPSGKVVDVAGAGAHDDTNIAIWESNGTAAQQWYLASSTTADDRDCYILVSASNGKAMDLAGNITGANVRIYTQNNSAAQNWIFRPCTQSIADGAYIIQSSADNNYVVSVANPDAEDCINIQLGSSNGSLEQIFALNYDAYSGYYTLTNYGSGRRVDVKGASNLEGVNIWQYAPNGGAAQFWRIVENENGTYTFVSALSPYVMDVLGGIMADGQNIQTYTSNGTAAQQFVLAVANPTISAGSVRVQNGSDVNLVTGVVNESTSAGASLQLEYNGYSINQHFVLEANEDGTYNLRPIMSGLLVSAGEEGAVTQEKANSVFAQKWVIAPTLDGHFTLATVDGVLLGANGVAAGQTLLASAAAKGAIWNLISVPLLPTGFYNIKLVGDSGIVLDVSENSVRPHANVGGWEDNGTNAQKFLISNIEGDVYQIFGAWSALALDVTDEVAAAGANIQQFNKNDSPAQKWIITWENGGFIFKSALGEFALSLVEKDGVYNAELSDYDKNNDNQRFLISQAKLTKASISDLVAVLDEYCYGNGLKAFKSMNELSSATTAKLWSAIQAFYNIGCSVGFTMLDLNTGIGLTYNSERVFDSACSIKGPYSIALAQYSPESLWKYENEFYWALHVSDNPTYQKYFFNSGTWPLNNYAAQVHLEHFSWNSWVAHYTAEDLCRLWVASQEYLLSDTKEAAWLRNVLYQNGANMTRIACAEYEVWPVFAKSGWTNYTRTEGSLVMADSPYVCGIMSTTNKEHSYLLVNLADAIYLAHQELVYGV